MKKTLYLSVIALLLYSCQMNVSNTNTEMEYYQSEEMAALGLPFSDAVRVGNMLYLSGQIGNVPGELKLVDGGLQAEARQTMQNIDKVLKANGTSLEHAVKLTIFIDDISRWGEFNEIYKEFFPGKKPARSAFGAEGLALGASVEVECIAYIPD